MQDHQQSVSNLTTSYTDAQTLIDSLTDDQLGVQSLCPAWNVRDVVLHVLGVEHCLIGWKPTSNDDSPPFALVAEVAASHADDDAASLAAFGRSVFGQRRDELESATDDDLNQLCMSPVGQVPYATFMAVRNFDIWVHHRDITTPLGLSTDDGGPAAEAALDQIHSSLGYIVGKKIGLPEGMTITITVSGPVDRTMMVAVDGRARVVDDIDGTPSVALATDSLTFVQLACGRIDPDEAISAGRVTWTGDDEWGSRAARNLAFTM